MASIYKKTGILSSEKVASYDAGGINKKTGFLSSEMIGSYDSKDDGAAAAASLLLNL